MLAGPTKFLARFCIPELFIYGGTHLRFRASKSITRLRLRLHIRSQLASADRCLSQQYATLIATKLLLTASHGTIPFKCGMLNTTAELWTSFIRKIQGMESRACTC